MSLFVTYNGVDQGNTSVRLGALGLTSAADSSPSFGSIVFDDPTGTRTITGWKSFTVDEPQCVGSSRLFTGYVADRRYNRGPYRTGAGRWIDTTIVDQNAVLGLRLITGSDGKRPAETHIERIDWLLASAYLSGLIVDDGLVYRGNPRPFGEADYRGQYAYDVLNDIAAPIFQTYFAVWSQTTHRVGLFFNQPNATTNTSTLTISNVLTDVNGSTCFAPSIEAEMVRDPSEVYSTVRMTHKYGTVLATRASTATAFIGRGLQVNNDRIGQASALVMSESLLDRSADEADTMTLTVQLPASKVGLIDAGMRVGVRFSHIPGFETLTYSRVTRRNIAQAEGNDQFYDVSLELSTHGLSPGGGGAGGFPYATGCTDLALVNSKFLGAAGGGTPSAWNTGTPTQGANFTPTSGNVLLFFGAHRAGTLPSTDPVAAGWTALASVAADAFHNGILAVAKISNGTETGISWPSGTFPHDWVVYEVSGTTVSGALTATVDTHAASATWTSGSVTPTTGNAAFIAGLIAGADDTWSGSATPAAGWTEYGDTISSGNQPHTTTIAQLVGSASGSYNPTTVASASHEYSGATVGLVCVASTPSDNPPIAGQWFYNVVPTPVADGSTVTFTLPAGYEFADGSLLVKVDRLDQTAAVTSYSGTARTFTLAFAPATGELIEVTGQGR